LVPPVGFYSELWRPPQDDPDLPALTAKYGPQNAATEVITLQMQLPREVVIAAGGVLHTFGRIEELLAELQAYVSEHVQPWPVDERPKYGVSIGHPLVAEASFGFTNFLSWLRAVDERLDRPHRPGRTEPRVGLLPALADRPLRSKIEGLVMAFRTRALERKLANYALHSGAVPQPMEGASLTDEHRVVLRVPDRPKKLVPTRWHLTFEEERDGLAVAREAAEAVGELVDGIIDAFEAESDAVTRERSERRAAIEGGDPPAPHA
jgi:hypothetical protein